MAIQNPFILSIDATRKVVRTENDMSYDSRYYDFAQISNHKWYAQTFTPNMAYNIYSLDLYMRKVEYDEGNLDDVNIFVYLTEADSDGLPVTGASGIDQNNCLGYSSKRIGDITSFHTEGRWIPFTLNQEVEIQADELYCIVVHINGGDAVNYLGWWYLV